MHVDSKDWAVTDKTDDTITVQHKQTKHVKVLSVDSEEAAQFGAKKSGAKK